MEAGQWRGPLHGVPLGVKDFYDTAGVRTTAAFERFANRVPSRDADVVTRLKAAGAIVSGKTNIYTLGDGNHRPGEFLWARSESVECRLRSRWLVERVSGRGRQRYVLRDR
jgi:Asp-tRNA(Asn)/Glu-tRNA(Gln) amidotransferase A subunit family amidase